MRCITVALWVVLASSVSLGLWGCPLGDGWALNLHAQADWSRVGGCVELRGRCAGQTDRLRDGAYFGFWLRSTTVAVVARSFSSSSTSNDDTRR